MFAALLAFLYAWRHRKRVVLDAHSAAFMNPRSRWLQRLLCRRAATTSVHHEHIASLVSGADGRTTLVPDVPIVFSTIERIARRLPDVTFFVTGNARHLDAALAASRPANVHLTRVLSAAAYGGLLTDARADADHTR